MRVYEHPSTPKLGKPITLTVPGGDKVSIGRHDVVAVHTRDESGAISRRPHHVFQGMDRLPAGFKAADLISDLQSSIEGETWYQGLKDHIDPTGTGADHETIDEDTLPELLELSNSKPFLADKRIEKEDLLLGAIAEVASRLNKREVLEIFEPEQADRSYMVYPIGGAKKDIIGPGGTHIPAHANDFIEVIDHQPGGIREVLWRTTANGLLRKRGGYFYEL